jgi:RNA polymerase sigma-70 factor (ECF subfamily)
MDDHQWLAAEFEAKRAHLRAVAYRMLGSSSEADDAVQEAWLHVTRGGAHGVDNLGGWLTTIVARVCLDMLRLRKVRREAPPEPHAPEPIANPSSGADPEQEALLADSVGLALLVVLETLTPAERLAFVLHEMFGVSFDEIARIVGRSPAAARQLASRARRRIQGTKAAPEAELAEQREVVAAFLAALRSADVEGLVAVLDPDVVARADAATAPPRGIAVRGARNFAQGAIAFARAVGNARPALVEGTVGLIHAPHGRLARVLRFTYAGGRIAQVDIIGDPEHLHRLEVTVVDAQQDLKAGAAP